MKKLFTLLLTFTLVFIIAGCEDDVDLTTTLENVIDISDTSEDLTDEDIVFQLDTIISEIREGEFVIDETYEPYELDNYTTLDTTLDSYTLTSGGVYVLEGTYTSTIIIDAGDEDVDLVLVNATISTTSGPAILVLSGDEITISATPNTENVIEDSINHPLDGDQDYNAAIYSKSDLVFNGTGTLTVNGNYNNAINSRDDIKIVDLTLVINSVDDGIIGKDYVAIAGATINLVTTGDGIKSTNDEDASRGFIYIESGIFDLTVGADGIQAENSIFIYDGTFVIDSSDDGIQATSSMIFGGGTFTITSDDDALNCDAELVIYDGNYTITAGDDAIHGYDMVLIEGGTIDVLGSYEGIESLVIEINGGTMNVVSTDDAINATVGGGQEHGPQYVSLGGSLSITGGIIQINSDGDGVDVNGSATMSGGYLIVYGPVTDMESTIDFDGTFTITGGLVVGIGSDGMLQSLSNTSTQNSLTYADGESYKAGTVVSLKDEDGNIIIEIEAIKAFEAVVISSEEMTTGDTYTFKVGSDSFEFTISSIVTTLGSGSTITEGGFRPPRP